MLDVRAATIIYQSQVKLASLVDNLITSKRFGKHKDPIWQKCLLIRRYLSALQYSDHSTDQAGQTYILECLIQLTGINNFPSSPTLEINSAPTIIIGQKGDTGAPGPGGATGPTGLATDFSVGGVASNSTIDSFNISTAPAARWEYVVTEAGGAQRSGAVRASWSSNGLHIDLADFSHADIIGSTAGIEFDVIYSAPNIILQAVVTSGVWSVRGSRYYTPTNGNGAGPVGSVLLDNHVYFGNASNVATGVTVTGDVTTTNAGVVTLSNSVVTNAKVASGAAIAVNKLAALTASLAVVTDSSGFLTTQAGITPTLLGYLTGLTGNIQAQITAGLVPSLTASRPIISNGSGALTANAALTSNTLIKWSGTAFSNSLITDDGSTVTIGGTVNISAGNVVRIDGANQVLTKILNIGDWNMSSTATVNVPHGLNYKKIRSIVVIVRDDTDVIYDNLARYDAGATGDIDGNYTLSGTTNVSLTRKAGGVFATTAYDSTSYNRGFITITYEI